MRLSRFYIDHPLETGQLLELEGGPANHIAKVLRLRAGASLILFTGHGGEYQATIRNVDRRTVHIEVGAHNPVERESPLHTTLVQAVSTGERMDYAVQKAVELGVSRIVPVIAERSANLSGDREKKRQAHWQRVAEAACEQCGRNTIPRVESVWPLAQWLDQEHTGLRLLMDPRATMGIGGLEKNGRVQILVGPEGGFAEGEIAQALDSGFQTIRFGPRVLRTETAAAAMLAGVQLAWGDLSD